MTAHLSQYISDHKKQFLEEVLAQRTRHVAVVLEDIFQSQNASAVFRTAECFGIQDVHLIENISKYALNKRVLRGANKWLTVHRHGEPGVNNTIQCLRFLKSQGYQIMATTPSSTSSIHEVATDKKLAILLGNELHGLSDEAIKEADVRVKIPMYGFTESLNLSVSAAICISEIIYKMKRTGVNWQLDDESKNQLRLNWYRKIIRNAGIIEKKYLMSIE